MENASNSLVLGVFIAFFYLAYVYNFMSALWRMSSALKEISATLKELQNEMARERDFNRGRAYAPSPPDANSGKIKTSLERL